jgi:hypothetical protein
LIFVSDCCFFSENAHTYFFCSVCDFFPFSVRFFPGDLKHFPVEIIERDAGLDHFTGTLIGEAIGDGTRC